MKTDQLKHDTFYYDNSIGVIYKYLGKAKNEHTYKYKFSTTNGGLINMSAFEVCDLLVVKQLN